MRTLSSYINEALGANFYSAKQAIAMIKKNLEQFETDDDKAYAVFQSLSGTESGDYRAKPSGYSILNGSGSKMLVKSAEYDTYGKSEKSIQNAMDRTSEKYAALFDTILRTDGYIENLYYKGEKIQERKLKEKLEEEKKAKLLAKTQAYKDLCDEVPGFHKLNKAICLSHAWNYKHLWAENPVKNDFQRIQPEYRRGIGFNDKSSIDEFADKVENDKYYICCVADYGNPAEEMDILKYLGDGKFEIVAKSIGGRHCSGYILPEGKTTRRIINLSQFGRLFIQDLEDYMKTHQALIDEMIKVYGELIKKDYTEYSDFIKALIERDSIV